LHRWARLAVRELVVCPAAADAHCRRRRRAGRGGAPASAGGAAPSRDENALATDSITEGAPSGALKNRGGVMRLSTVEKPKSLMVRFAYWMSRRKLGKVMTPLAAVYA